MPYEVAIIVPTYKRRYCWWNWANYYRRQTFQNCHLYILEDDPEEDGDIFFKRLNLPFKYDYITSKTARGMSKAFKLGVDISSEPLIYFASDDMFPNDDYLLAKMVKALRGKWHMINPYRAVGVLFKEHNRSVWHYALPRDLGWPEQDVYPSMMVNGVRMFRRGCENKAPYKVYPGSACHREDMDHGYSYFMAGLNVGVITNTNILHLKGKGGVRVWNQKDGSKSTMQGYNYFANRWYPKHLNRRNAIHKFLTRSVERGFIPETSLMLAEKAFRRSGQTWGKKGFK